MNSDVNRALTFRSRLIHMYVYLSLSITYYIHVVHIIYFTLIHIVNIFFFMGVLKAPDNIQNSPDTSKLPDSLKLTPCMGQL